MASRPGLLTEWPWRKLGNFKYVVIAPWVAHSFYLLTMKSDAKEALFYHIIFPFMLLRMLHSQIWISISRLQTARSPHRIVDKSIEFEQIDRERNWDDHILLGGMLAYLIVYLIPDTARISMWRFDGAIITIVLHAGPIEFLYYWFHRALHHQFLYSRYHSHHHASIATEPITSVVHPFAEHIAYYILFTTPLMITKLFGIASIMQTTGYICYLDFMNNLGHCNFEFVPKWMFSLFPPLKYLMYTPSFHSLHHTKFRTNYSLFMPFYDYLYNTMDKSSDDVYELSSKGKKEATDIVHLTHPTTLQSIYHFRLGIASLASKPFKSNWYDFMMWPMAWVFMLLTWFYSSVIIVERNKLKNIIMQTWVIPRYNFQFSSSLEGNEINDLIGKIILLAESNGVKILSLGLLNQAYAKAFNGSGEFYLQKYPSLKVRIVDGSSLAAALVLHIIPHNAQQILVEGYISKVARIVIQNLCIRGVKVLMTNECDYYTLKPFILGSREEYLQLSSNCKPQVWLVGDGVDDSEQRKAQRGTIFIPFSHFPPKKVRKDCLYHTTPAMRVPNELQNLHSCENWLPRKVMSAWRVAGILHGLEGWNGHECGETVLPIEKVWSAALKHGFLPLSYH